MIDSEFVVSFLIAYAIVAYIPLWLALFVVVSLMMSRVIKYLLWFLFAYPVLSWKRMVTAIWDAYFSKNSVEVADMKLEEDEVEIRDE